MSEQCVICGKQTHIGYLCRPHLERLGVMLREIEDECALIDARPSMAVAQGNRGARLASQRSPGRLDAIALMDVRTTPYAPRVAGPACRDCTHGTCTVMRSWENARAANADRLVSVLGTLASWARLVREDRELAWPDRVTVMSERRTLTAQLDWIAAQAWIDEFASELKDVLAQLRAVNGTNEVRPKAVGLCPTLYDDGECGGRLWPDDIRGDVGCDKCGRVFTPEELRHLGEMLIRQGYVEVFRAEWFTGVPAGTIRRWVAEQRCTSEKDGRKLLVQISEVEALRDRRKVRRVAS